MLFNLLIRSCDLHLLCQSPLHWSILALLGAFKQDSLLFVSHLTQVSFSILNILEVLIFKFILLNTDLNFSQLSLHLVELFPQCLFLWILWFVFVKNSLRVSHCSCNVLNIFKSVSNDFTLKSVGVLVGLLSFYKHCGHRFFVGNEVMRCIINRFLQFVTDTLT